MKELFGPVFFCAAACLALAMVVTWLCEPGRRANRRRRRGMREGWLRLGVVVAFLVWSDGADGSEVVVRYEAAPAMPGRWGIEWWGLDFWTALSAGMLIGGGIGALGVWQRLAGEANRKADEAYRLGRERGADEARRKYAGLSVARRGRIAAVHGEEVAS